MKNQIFKTLCNNTINKLDTKFLLISLSRLQSALSSCISSINNFQLISFIQCLVTSKTNFRKILINWIFIFLPFLTPILFFFKEGDYMLSICFIIVGIAFCKFRYNWVYFGDDYRDKFKKGLVKKRSLSIKIGRGYIEGAFLLAVFFAVLCFYSCFVGNFLFAIIFFVMALLFTLFCYLFIKF